MIAELGKTTDKYKEWLETDKDGGGLYQDIKFGASYGAGFGCAGKNSVACLADEVVTDKAACEAKCAKKLPITSTSKMPDKVPGAAKATICSGYHFVVASKKCAICHTGYVKEKGTAVTDANCYPRVKSNEAKITAIDTLY